MHQAYKFRFYPTKQQISALNQIFGCGRYVYNWALITKRDAYALDKTKIKYTDLSRSLTQLKKDPDKSWLTEVPATCLIQSIRDLDDAYQRFFAKQTGYPKFKKKSSTGSARFQDVVTKSGQLRFPKIGPLKIKAHRDVPGICTNNRFIGTPKTATISRNASNQYYVSFTIEIDQPLLLITGRIIGIDVGLKSFYTDSNNQTVEAARLARRKKKAIARSQRALARSEKNSKRREKKRLRLAKQHQKIKNQRTDQLHKLTTNIVKNNDIIVVEKLNIKGMSKNHKLAFSIIDASWGTFFSQLRYKSSRYGRTYLEVDPKNTSRTCHVCGELHNVSMTLDIRSWTCGFCETNHDRDHNAAINIRNRGMDLLSIPRGAGNFKDVDQCSHGLVELSPVIKAHSNEASIRVQSQAATDDSVVVQ